jgi:hypothetical protein
MLALADVSFTAIGYAKSERRQVQTARQRLALTEENRHQREMHGVDQSGFADTAMTMPTSELEHPNVNFSKSRCKASERRVNSNS